MKPIFVSAEQELVLREHLLLQTWAQGEPPTEDQFHHHYIVISETPFGHEGPGWVPALIGPFSEHRIGKAMDQLVCMLKAMGHTVYTTDDFEEDQWGAGGTLKVIPDN